MSRSDRVVTMAHFALMEREATLYANREQIERRRKGRAQKNADREAEIREWGTHRGAWMERAGLTILHHGWSALEIDLGNGLRAHVRRSGAGFHVAVLGKVGARGRMSVKTTLRILDALAAVTEAAT